MTLRVGVDFDGDNWVAGYASSTDAPNLLGAGSLRGAYRRVSGAGGVVVEGSSTGSNIWNIPLHGPMYYTWEVGTANPAYLEIG
jgi:hypothetical protein